MKMKRRRARTRTRMWEAAAALAALAGGCVPDVGSDPIPTVMEFDLTATPPRAPQPTFLVVDPITKHINFALAGIDIPADCATQTALTQADCQFDQWLQTLNGFPSVTPASAPANGPLDPATLTPGDNVVVVGVKAGAPVTDLTVGFDDASTSLTLTPPPWTLGEFYWMGVRGYAHGVHAPGGGKVVGAPTMALIKQETSLTCDAATPADVRPDCPAFQVVAQRNPNATSDQAAGQLFQLEQIRQAYLAGPAPGAGGFDVMTAAGLPKEEIAVLWGFPIHTNSVPVLVPNTMAVPHVPANNQILVGVQGPVDPTTVSAFVVTQQNGPVVVMDLTAAAAGDLSAGFPPVDARFVMPSAGVGVIAITAAAPFPAGHTIGLFFTNKITSPDGAPLVASPVSVLLTLTAPLVDSSGHSTVSGVSDADATALEAGRQGLAQVLDLPVFSPLTGVTRANIVYAYAFVPVQP